MKNTLKILTILCLSVFLLQAQDITNKLGGNTANETYDVTDSADNVLFRVQGDGKVGIGETNPSEVLDVDGNIKVSGTVDGVDIATDVTANTAKVTNATHTGDVTGATTLTIGADKVTEAHLKAVDDPADEEYLTYETTTGDFEWQALPSSGDSDWTILGNDMYSAVSGNVGIGNDSPTYKLDVKDGRIRLEGSDPIFMIDPEPNGTAYISVAEAGEDLRIQAAEGIDFHTFHSTLGWGSRMIIENDGNVGIGDTSPDALLDVAGSFRVDGTFGDKDGEAGTSGQILSSTATGTNWIDAPSGGDSDWTISGNDMNSAVSGNVGIGGVYSSAKFNVSANMGQWDYIARFNNTSTESNTFGVWADCSAADDKGTGGRFEGGYQGVSGYVFPSATATGIHVGVNGDARGGVGTNMGVWGYAEVEPGGTAWSGYFSEHVMVGGTLTKGAGSFRIDHPLDPENKYLYHSFVESPDMMNVYNGNIITNRIGIAFVELPEYFDALNSDFRYQLTVIGEFAQAIVLEEISNNQFTIKTDKPNIKVSWQVTGIRQDAYANSNRIPVEEYKPYDLRGKYQNPKAFNQPESKMEHYDLIQEKQLITD